MESLPINSFQIDIPFNSNELNYPLFRAHATPGGTISSKTLKYLKLTEKLNDETRGERSYFKPKNGEFFAWKCSNCWFRGYVISDDCNKFHTFLIDNSIYQDIYYSRRVFQKLPPWFSTTELNSQSFKVALYGVVPLTENINEGLHKKKTDMWEAYQIDFMKRKIKEAEKIHFAKVCDADEIKFGYIIVEKDGIKTTLQEMLILENMATVCEDSVFVEKEIPTMVRLFRKFPTFDQQLSVRKKLYPREMCWKLELEELSKTSYSSSENVSGLSNISDYSSLSDHSSASRGSFNEEQPEFKKGPTNMFAYLDKLDSGSEETSEYGSSEENMKNRSKNENRHTEDNEAVSSENLRNNTEHKYKNVTGLEPLNKWCLWEDIFILGSHYYFKPISSFADTLIDDKTLEMIDKNKVSEISRCQRFMIPAMFSGSNIVLIDAPGSGKSAACSIALVSLLRKSKKKNLGVSPRALYILPYSSSCEKIRNLCVQLITGKKSYHVEDNNEYDLRVTVAYGSGQKLENIKLTELAVGYDILICTPRCLLRLLKNTRFDLRRLEYVVIDEFHTIHNSYQNELDNVMRYVQFYSKEKHRNVVISNSWLPEIDLMMDKYLSVKKRTLLIPCFLEAALCVRIEFELAYRHSEPKIVDEIRTLLTDDPKANNVVIVVNDENAEQVVERLYLELVSSKRRIHKIFTALPIDQEKISVFKDDISEGRRPVLICSDYVLSSVKTKIYEADCLIHYSLPTTVKGFAFRFSVILNGIRKIATKELPRQSVRVQTYIDSSSTSRQVLRLQAIMKRYKCDIPTGLQNILSLVSYNEEIVRPDICLDLKQFGSCTKVKNCTNRHIFVLAKDRPDPLLPQAGQVEVDVTHVYSPTHFRVRIIRHRHENTEWTKFAVPDGRILELRLQNYFKKNEIRAFEYEKEGDVAVYSSSCGYKRVKILKFVGPTNKNGKYQKALLKYIDSGEEEERALSALCQLPSNFASIPETTFDVFICNLLPLDEDVTWGSVFIKTVEKIVHDVTSKNKTFVGSIQLVIGNCLWLDSLHYKWSMGSTSITDHLLLEKLAVKNKTHLKVLHEKCQEAGLLDHNRESTNNSFSNEQLSKITSNDGTDGQENEITLDNSTPSDTQEKTDTTNSSNATSVPENSSTANNTNQNASANPPFCSREDGSFPFRRPVRPSPKRINEYADQALKPPVFWRQDSQFVWLTIKKNIDTWTLKHDGFKQITFEGKEGQTLYRFDEALRACIDPNSVQHYKSGINVIVKLGKLSKDTKWRRLLEKHEPVKWVKEDYLAYCDSSDVDSEKHYVDLKFPTENLETCKSYLNNLPTLARLPDYSEPSTDEMTDDAFDDFES